MTKQNPDHIDQGDYEGHAVDEKNPQVQVDPNGGARKTDPREIALVRKLDYRIMVSL